jgi:hypothetical protein
MIIKNATLRISKLPADDKRGIEYSSKIALYPLKQKIEDKPLVVKCYFKNNGDLEYSYEINLELKIAGDKKGMY